jgi:hypothetical protein
MELMEGVTNAFKSMKPLLLGLGVAVLTYIVLLIIVGVFANLVSDGTIEVTAAINTAIQGTLTTMISIGTAGFAALLTIAGFIVIGVLLALFGPMLGLNIGTKTKGSRRRRF